MTYLGIFRKAKMLQTYLPAAELEGEALHGLDPADFQWYETSLFGGLNDGELRKQDLVPIS